MHYCIDSKRLLDQSDCVCYRSLLMAFNWECNQINGVMDGAFYESFHWLCTSFKEVGEEQKMVVAVLTNDFRTNRLLKKKKKNRKKIKYLHFSIHFFASYFFQITATLTPKKRRRIQLKNMIDGLGITTNSTSEWIDLKSADNNSTS